MIGNDVVDRELAAKQSNWRRPRFLEKVFTSSECAAINVAEDRDLYVWLLWSMKEAAYKAHQRQFALGRRLRWKTQEAEISILDASAASGMVWIEKEIYFTCSQITSEVVSTTAINHSGLSVKNFVFERSSDQVKAIFLQEFAREYSLPEEELEIIKNKEGVPFLRCKNQVLKTSFSFTGHGRFCAFSMPLINC